MQMGNSDWSGYGHSFSQPWWLFLDLLVLRNRTLSMKKWVSFPACLPRAQTRFDYLLWQ